MEITINVRYDGLDAANHRLDMKQFGQSLIGLEKLLTVGLTAIAERQIPHPRAIPSIAVKASVPTIGCVDFNAIILTVPGVLPLIFAAMNDHSAEIAWKLLSAVLSKVGGKAKIADDHVTDIIALSNNTLSDRQLEREFVLQIVDKLAPSAKAILSPVGPSCDTLRIEGAQSNITVIDVPMADAARSREKLEVGDMARMRIRVDGVIKHNRSLKVELPESPGRFLTADVRDPAFDETPNAYTHALDGDGFLEVDAKPTFRANGELAKLYIMNVVSVAA